MKEIIGLGPTFGFGGPVDLNDAVPGVARPRRASVRVRTFTPRLDVAQVLYLRPDAALVMVNPARPRCEVANVIAFRPATAPVAVRTATPKADIIENLKLRPEESRVAVRTFQPDARIAGVFEARPVEAAVKVRCFQPRTDIAVSIIARPAEATVKARGFPAVATAEATFQARPDESRVAVRTFQPFIQIVQVETARPEHANVKARTYTPLATVTAPPVEVQIPNQTLATGLTSIADYSPEFPFRDIMRNSRPWIADWTNGNAYVRANGHVNDDGWPISIPTSGQLRTVWAMPERAKPYFDNTTWTIRWTGTGSIRMGGDVTGVSIDNANNTGTFTIAGATASDTTFWLEVFATNAEPNNVRDIEVIRNDWLAGYDAGEIFNPDFLSFHETMGYVRFMDWQRTNGSPQTDWITRARPGVQTYSDGDTDELGVPLETCIALCNKMLVPGWFCIPHLATDDYVTQMATLLRDNMDPSLPIYFEYSNEVWNGGFDQHAYAISRGRSDWPGASAESDFTIALNWAGKRMSQCFQIVNSVFAGNLDRVKNVLGTQAGIGAWGVEQVAAAPVWQAQQPGTYVKPASVAQYVAMTSYFGSGMADDPTFVSDVTAAYPATSDDVIQGYITDPNSSLTTLPEWRLEMLDISGEAVVHGLELLMYEGGTHIIMNNAYSDTIEAAVLQHHASAYEAQNYEYLWNVWVNEVASGGPFSGYLGVDDWGGFGYWSLVEYPTQSPLPFAAKLFELSAATGPWWIEGGSYLARTNGSDVKVRTFVPRDTGAYVPPSGDWSLNTAEGGAIINSMPAQPSQPTGSAKDASVQIDALPVAVPGKIESVTLTPGDSQITVDWEVPPTGPAPTGYYWEWSNDGGATFTWLTNQSNGTDRGFIQGADNGTTYHFRIRATNENGAGPWSDVVSATPSAA